MIMILDSWGTFLRNEKLLLGRDPVLRIKF